MVIETAQPLLPIAIILVVSVLILLSRKRPNVREFWSIAGAILTFAAVVMMVPSVWQGHRLVYTLSTIAPGISLNFRVDALSLVFGIVSSFLWIFASVYNVGYMRTLKEHAQTRYYLCFAVAILGAQGVSYSGSLFSLYLFYEIITLFTYPLVAHHQDEEGYAGGKKYLVYLMGTSKGLLLPAVILTYIMTGTLDFSDTITSGVFRGGADSVWITVTYVLFIFGFAKAAPAPGSSGVLRWRDPRAFVPADYLIRRNGTPSVFVVSQGRARFVPLPGAQEGRPAAVVALPADVELVTDGRFALQDGMAVSLR